MRIENNNGTDHYRIKFLPTIEYEYDWGDKYISIYFLFWQLIFKLRRKHV